MKTIKFDNQESWEEFRAGKITGSTLDDVFAVKEVTVAEIKAQLDEQGIEYKKSAKREDLLALLPEAPQAKLIKKLQFYELLAHRVAVPEQEDENPMDRGSRLEEEALAKYAEKQGLGISNDLVMWVSDENDSLAYSPDGVVSDEEVVETKCLSSAMHLYIYYEKEIPAKYQKQNLQAFIVNDKLQKLHFVCYDPRIPALPIHSITITREEVADQIALYKQYEKQLVAELNQLAEELTF
jgi:hypothetical protein